MLDVAGYGTPRVSPGSRRAGALKYPVVIVALAGFVLLINVLLGMTKAPEQEWTRAVYLFTGVEATAFAAAGCESKGQCAGGRHPREFGGAASRPRS